MNEFLGDPNSNLWYAELIAALLVASNSCAKASDAAIQAKDNEIFDLVHDMRMKLMDTASKLVKNPKA